MFGVILLFNLILFLKNNRYKKIIEFYENKKSKYDFAGFIFVIIYYFISSLGALYILINMKKL
jgi:hypothetical protein